MYVLDLKQTENVTGATLVLVTDEWKESRAQGRGYLLGSVLAFFGGITGAVSAFPITMGFAGVYAGYKIGSYLGYYSAKNDYAKIENNTWYDVYEPDYID